MREKQLSEALKRLIIIKQQGLLTDIDIVDNLCNGGICYSAPMNIMGDLVGVVNTVSDNSELSNLIDEFKMAHPNLLPYFIIDINTHTMGRLVSVFYVSDQEKEWEQDRKDLIRKTLCSYTYSADERFWDIGYISYDIFNGGPIRTS